MLYKSSKLADVPVGSKFMHNCHMYMRVNDIKQFTEKYPGAVTVLNLDNHTGMIMHGDYEVDEVIEKEEIIYE